MKFIFTSLKLFENSEIALKAQKESSQTCNVWNIWNMFRALEERKK